MGSPVIFSGRRAKVLTADGLLLSSNSKVDYDGPVNYITNGHAAVNTDGWATYADAAASSPVDGTGGSPNVTLTRSTTTPLRGQASFLITKDAADRQGQGASYNFTIDESDKGKTLFINFNYSVASGTYASSDLAVFVYDVTNASIITPSNNGIDTTSTSAIESISFSSSATSTSYRLIIHVASTSALAYTFKLDAISVGPVAIAYSSPTPNSSMTLDNLALSASVASSALTIAIKTRALADASATDPISIGFRNATAATGDFNVRTVTSALSLTISSGSTLGHRNGDAFYIYVYAIDSGSGTVLGVSSALHDDGTIKSTTAEGGAGAADAINTIYTSSAQTNKPIRLIGRLTSTQTTAGTWAAVPTEISLPPFSRSGLYTGYVRLFTGNGFGSTNTKIRRFATIQNYGGTDITITQSSTLGDSFTFNSSGVYSISYGDEGNTGAPQAGITLNSANLTTDINALPDAEVLIFGGIGTGNDRKAVSYTGRFSAGDIIRAHTNSGTAGFISAAFGTRFAIAKVSE